jgi:predicted nucleic acid-binding protein
MNIILIDSNLLLDVLTEDPQWFSWSAQQIERLANDCLLAINPLIYAEVSVGFKRIEDLEDALPETAFARLTLPWEAAFCAGKCFLEYRRRNGTRTSPLHDFYIGAHAAVSGFQLLTRDARRYRSYFPELKIIAPDSTIT